MTRSKVFQEVLQPNLIYRWTGIIFLFLLAAGVVYGDRFLRCIDGCGPYHNTTSVADLDGDGDLDVVLSNLRHESESGFWAGPTLWINQGGGKFTPKRVDMGGPATAAGDLDGDGDADLVNLEYTRAELYLNQGGEQAGKPGDFRIWHRFHLQKDPRSGPTPASVLLGDLNNDGRLDAFIGECCGLMVDSQVGGKVYLASLSWLWINTPDQSGHPLGYTLSLSSLGDLPIRPALGDLDNDGDLDVFAAIQPPKKGADTLSSDRVLLNDGSGGFRDSGQLLISAGDADSTAAALGDLDGDGDLDALVGKTRGAIIWTNQGGVQGGHAGVFAANSAFAANRLGLGRSRIEAVFLADLDNDGDPDALLAETAQASIWWNDGQAGFRDSEQRLSYTERHGLAIDDFNADGYLDVFSAAYDLEFHLWLNQADGRLQKAN